VPVNQYHTEKVSITGLAMSAEGTRFVALGPQYDVVFDAPQLIRAIKSDLHPYMVAEIRNAYVNTPGKISATVNLYIKDAPVELPASAVEMGFKPQQDQSGVYSVRFNLAGTLHRASETWPNNFALNQPYEVEIRFLDGVVREKRTERTSAGDVVKGGGYLVSGVAGIIAMPVLVPVMLKLAVVGVVVCNTVADC
jgi:hypothetical protein